MSECRPSIFRFKQFSLSDSASAMKIGTDGVLLGSWAFENERPQQILDVGTGTGLIALMMAQRFYTARITAIEINSTAAAEAQQNVDNSPWSERVSIYNCDFCDFTSERFDAIVSNPPFFLNGEKSHDSARAQARHSDNLSPDLLLKRSSEMLIPGGKLAIIFPAEFLDYLIYRGTIYHLDASRIALVKPSATTSPIRVMIEFTKDGSITFSRETINIREVENRYSERYASLTSTFYL